MQAQPEITRWELVKQFGKEQAEKYLAVPALPGERVEKETHWQFLKKEIESGRFTCGRIATVTVKDREYRLNGQHQCRALLACSDGTTIRAEIEEYRVDTTKEAAELYDSFDGPISTRTWAELLAVLQQTSRHLSQLSPRVLTACIAAVCFHKAGKIHTWRDKYTRVGRFEIAVKERVSCGIIAEIVAERKKAQHLIRQPVFAAMFETILVDPEVAKTFWTQVRDGIELHEGDPALMLRERLKDTSCKIGTSKRSQRTLATFADMYTWSIHAWNAW